MVATIQGRFYANFTDQGPAVEWVTITGNDNRQEFNKVL